MVFRVETPDFVVLISCPMAPLAAWLAGTSMHNLSVLVRMQRPCNDNVYSNI